MKHPFFGSKGKQDTLEGERFKYFEWPTTEQFEAFPGIMRIKSMNFKAGNFKTLSGIQIIVTNDKETITSPVFTGYRDSDPMKIMHDVSKKHISKVGMRIQGESTQTGASQSYFGLYLYDDN